LFCGGGSRWRGCRRCGRGRIGGCAVRFRKGVWVVSGCGREVPFEEYKGKFVHGHVVYDGLGFGEGHGLIRGFGAVFAAVGGLEVCYGTVAEDADEEEVGC